MNPARRPSQLAFAALIASLLGARDLVAQGVRPATLITLGARAIPLATRATSTPGGRILTEAYLSQPAVAATLTRAWLRIDGMLDLEGTTLQRGELVQGAWGEGFVDRRHPHAYVHELLAGLVANGATRGASLFAGRGFVPFGSDDPMRRPFASFPVNHHLAQILERLVAVGAVRVGPVIGEAALFNGDEPIDPSTAPLFRRFADSWSARATLRAGAFTPALGGSELTASFASVRSPEYREGRGLDQRKVHIGVCVAGSSESLSRYALVEWARTSEMDGGRRLFRFTSVLAEGALCRGVGGVALRLERSERPEEERLLDPFRSPRPATDNSIVGVTRWTTVTGAASLSPASLGPIQFAPFIEIARIGVARASPAAFDPTVFYGSNFAWRLSAGARMRAGVLHERMGRYGAAMPVRSSGSGQSHAHPHADELRCFP